ncbi:dienelactone hydrolase family protein [Marinimicrobium locisalis]|uniref:dienelactone hydrolase family protein n=1 Tax=Marinimicrobium locisalis TaxID=546022 RepID=UPI003221BF2B
MKHSFLSTPRLVCFALAGVLLGTASLSHAEVQSREIDYTVNGETFTGYLAYDDRIEGERPGVLVVHEWWGHGDYVRKRADMLAELGYTAFALDMYGSGKYAEHPSKANEFMQGVMSNKSAAEQRFRKALSVLREQPMVEGDDIAAIGYCFGGAVVLHMARSGIDLDGVVSYHGMLSSETPAQPGDIQADVLVFTGEADPMVPAEQVKAFKQEMRSANADFKVHSYPGAKHAFTNPAATEAGKQHELPLAYDPEADADSWHKTQQFFNRIFD